MARLTFQPSTSYAFISRFRFDEETFDVRTVELEARAQFERWSVSALYGNYAAQPELGTLTRRQGILTTGSVKLTQNWSLFGGLRYDIESQQLNQTSLGLGYIDDCFGIRMTYQSSYGYDYNPLTPPEPQHTVVLQISLRTIGTTRFNQRLDTLTGITDTNSTTNPLHF